jgi:hypothetical protein
MSRDLPEPAWLDLSDARARAIRIFSNHAPEAGTTWRGKGARRRAKEIEAALIRAFYDDKIETRGRCVSWYGHDTSVSLENHVWDPDRVIVDWRRNSFRLFVYTTMGARSHEFKDVRVNRAGFLQWCGPTVAESRPSPSETAPSSGDRAKLRKWLVEQMKSAPDKPRPKSSMKREAAGLFKVSDRSFNAVWTEAVKESGASNWSKPGRRKS